MSDTRYPVLVIAGPTAGGKSARALEAAAERNGVIINADSMQIYDALPLLTAQPMEPDRAKAPHTLYGTMAPQTVCSAQSWCAMAIAEIDRAHKAGLFPIIVGGTGFYIKTLMKGLSPVPDIPLEVRAAATALQQQLGNPGFHEALAARDSAMAGRLHPNDTQRLIRAWEVLEHTGVSLAEWQEAPPAGASGRFIFETELIMPEREVLYDRCNRRFDLMMTQGALEEARAFHEQIESGAVPEEASVTHALGFRPLRRYFHSEISLDEAVIQAKAETRQYAKRQVTWFRNQLTE